jgi:hypothetical protein
VALRSGRPYIKFRERNNPCRCGSLRRPKRKDAIIARHKLHFAGHEIPLPTWKPLRIALGVAFLIGGMFAILPVLGLWMIPVGLLILSVDFPPVRRFRRRITSWYGRSRLRKTIGRLSRGWAAFWRKKKGPSG